MEFCHLRADVALVARMSLLAGALTGPSVTSLGQGADLGAEAGVALQTAPLPLVAVDTCLITLCPLVGPQ